MNFAFRSISFTLLKLLLVVLSFAFINPILAEENLYDRGKELVEQKEYQKAIKAFEFASKAGNLDALTALGVMHIGGIGVEQNNVVSIVGFVDTVLGGAQGTLPVVVAVAVVRAVVVPVH